MRAAEFKIGECVIERLGVELNNIRLAALVIGMAVLALDLANVRPLAVKARFSADILGDILVAIEAEPSLAFLGKGFMAALARLFKLDVAFDDIARHHEFLKQAFGPGSTGCQQDHCHADRQVQAGWSHRARHGGSIPMNGEDVEQDRHYQHDEERHVQNVPKGEKTFEKRKSFRFLDSGKVDLRMQVERGDLPALLTP